MAEDGELVEVRLLGLPLTLRAGFVQHTEGLLRELALIEIGADQAIATSLPRRVVDLAAELKSSYAPFQAGPAEAMNAAEAAGEAFCDVTYAVPPHVGPFVQRLQAALEEADEYCRDAKHLLTLPASEEFVAYRRWVFGEFVRQLGGQPPRAWHRGGRAAEVPTATAGAAASPDTDPGGVSPRNGPDPAVGRVVGEPLTLDSMASAVASVRRYVRSAVRELDAPELEESGELGVSELVTNAILHARTSFTVTVRAMPSGRLRIEVGDASPTPVQHQHPSISATTGRGLHVVASISHAWGVEQAADGVGKTVWFEPREAHGEDEAAQAWAAEVTGLL